MMGIRILMKKRQDKVDEEQGLEKSDEEKKKRTRLLLMLAIPLLAIVGIILFILTQDMRLQMIMVDWWTMAHLILFIGGVLCYIFAYRKRKDEDDDSAQPEGRTSAA